MRNRLVDRELLLAIEPAAQRFALDERHHVEQQSVRFARIEQRQQVRVLQVGRDPDLAQEPLDAEHRAEFRLEQLERDVAVVAEVAREVHGRHAADADLPLDAVPIRKCGLQAAEWVHWGLQARAGTGHAR